MRPEHLFPLFAELQSLDGIGPKIAARFNKLLAGTRPGQSSAPIIQAPTARIIDLLCHLPVSYIDRTCRPALEDVVPGTVISPMVIVRQHSPPPLHNMRAPYRIHCFDETGEIDIIYFSTNPASLRHLFPVDKVVLVSGKAEIFKDRLQISHPDYVLTPEQSGELPRYEPQYALTAGLGNPMIRKTLHAAWPLVPALAEWQDPDWLAQNQWPGFRAALRRIHFPETQDEASLISSPRDRLAYDELLANQLALALMRKQDLTDNARPLPTADSLRKAIRTALPFALTGTQEQVLAEIDQDLARPRRMLRLLQGDVGAGKTVVALLAMLNAVEAGGQAVIMAPTEVLARQHFNSFEPLCAAAGLTCTLLTGRDTGKARAQKLAAIKTGAAQIICGTHALFQKDVEFKALYLAVIDEQHRFGVEQRLALGQRPGAELAHMLVMTATPIPRTLVLTRFGDMAVSALTGKPAGRQPVTTRTISLTRLDDIIAGLKRAISTGEQIYWVCPLVEDSERLDLNAVEMRFKMLNGLFPGLVGLVHGKLPAAEKDESLAAFKAGTTQILVATTVIEVGVDVPNANIMVIEHAERFGLAQLHQLRGRVGRGSQPASCVLLYQSPLSNTARARLKMMRETNDGFVIAEEDLRLRGGGDVLGTRQSGEPGSRFADFPRHTTLLEAARDDAKLIMAKDPDLTSARGKALRDLLYLFERDQATSLLHAG